MCMDTHLYTCTDTNTHTMHTLSYTCTRTHIHTQNMHTHCSFVTTFIASVYTLLNSMIGPFVKFKCESSQSDNSYIHKATHAFLQTPSWPPTVEEECL